MDRKLRVKAALKVFDPVYRLTPDGLFPEVTEAVLVEDHRPRVSATPRRSLADISLTSVR
jgi:hypothetical protein